MGDVRVNRRIVIPEWELEFRASRASGPGGQGVNTTSSKVELRWNVRSSEALRDEDRQRLERRLANRITDDGVLILQASEYRSQHRNREAAVARLTSLVREAVTPPKRRTPTVPTPAAKRRRMEAKRRRAEIKRLRQPPTGE